MKTSLHLFMVMTLVVTVTSKLIDLSHDHGPDTIMSPNIPHFNLSTLFSGDYIPGIYVKTGWYSSGEHGGTHMDAPLHFQRGGQTLDKIPLENSIAEGVMIDCSEEAKKIRGYQVPLQKLHDWEKEHGQIPMDAAVIFNFGWSDRFHDKELYVGTSRDDQFSYVFPSVSGEAALWLYDERRIKIIGTDTMSPDPFSINGTKVTSFPIHQKYLPNHRLIIENLRGPEQLSPRGFRFHCAPVKFVGATGAQVRAYAMTHDSDMCSTAIKNGALMFHTLMAGILISLMGWLRKSC